MSTPFSRAAKKAEQVVYGKAEMANGQCQSCRCWFVCESDLEAHMVIHEGHKRAKAAKERFKLRNGWTRTRTRGIEKMRKESAPSLVAEVNSLGSFSRGGYRFWLFQDYVFRKREISR